MDKAIDAFQKAIEADPDDYRLYVNLGSCFEETRRTEEAIVTLRKAIATNQTKTRTFQPRQRLYQIRPDRGSGAPLPEILRNESKDANSYYSLAMALKAVGKIDDAKASYQKAIELTRSSRRRIAISVFS